MFMAYGMTYEQYWYGDPWMTRAYEQAYLLRRREMNENMWLMGAYVSNAVATAIINSFNKKKVEYLKKPMDIFPKTEREIEQEKREERKKLIRYLTSLKKNMKKKINGSGSDGKP